MIDIKNCFTYAYSAGTFADFKQNVNTDENCTSPIDLDTDAGLNIVSHKGPYLVIKSIDAAASTGTIEFRLISSTEEALTGGTTVIVAMWRFTDTQMAAGALLVNQQLPIGIYYQYLGIHFNIYTTTCAGILAYLSDAPEPAETVLGNTQAGS